ncbi:MAG: MMPL family transporter [Nitrospinae bacterium]|nr:MMPL family transporter [Nitrospinota bacterium]
MIENSLKFGINNKAYTMLVIVAVTVFSIFGLPKLELDTGFKSMISKSDPYKVFYHEIVREFGSDNKTIIYIRDKNLWTPKKLAAFEKLHYAFDKLPFVERVDDLFTLRNIKGKNGKITSHIFLPEAPKDQVTAEQVKKDVLYNPLLTGNFISKDGNVMAIIVSIKEDKEDRQFDHKVNDIFENIISQDKSTFDEIFQVGSPRINLELKNILFRDISLLGPLSAVILVLSILLFLKSWTAAFIPVATSILSIIWTFGIMGWCGIPVNILSAMLPTLIIVIGSTEDTHMISSYLQGLDQYKENKRDLSVRFMMTHMGVPLLLTILTTALGFASNIFTNIGLIQDFALASTFAILSNGFITILFVPIALSFIGPLNSSLFHRGEAVKGMPGLFVRLFGFTKSHFPRSILLITGIASIFFLYHASSLYVSNDPLSYFKQDRELIQQVKTIHHDLAGMKVFFVTLESKNNKAFLEPKNINKLVEIQKFMEKQGAYDRTISLADHLSLVNREFYNGKESYFTIPRKKELVAQYLLFFHSQDLSSFVSHDLRRANIVVRHNIGDSKTLNKYVNELRDVVRNIAGADMKAYVVGENLMVNAAAEGLLTAQVKSLFILLFVVFLIMSAMFTSLKGGLIAMIPNLIPIVFLFGCMGLLNIPLNPGTAMVAVIAIGIAIDGTIHLFSRYNELCRKTTDYHEAVAITVAEEATPMVATSLSLCFGFGILLLSEFTLIGQFGALSAATMIFSLFSNLLITPLIMSRVKLVGLYQMYSLTMQKEVFEKSPLFKDMSNYQIRKAIMISEAHDFEVGELLIKQGTVGRSMFLILEGKVEVTLEEGIKNKVVLSELSAGQVFGEIGFVKETKRTANIRALTPVSVLKFDYERLKEDLKFFPFIVSKINFNICGILGERLASKVETISDDKKYQEEMMKKSDFH